MKCVISNLKMEKYTMETYNDLLKEYEICRFLQKQNEELDKAFKLIATSSFKSHEDFSIVSEANQTKLMDVKFKYDVIEVCSKRFAICLLIDELKNVWISRRNNREKDFYDYYQVPGGMREVTSRGLETEVECVLREIKEETNIVVKDEDLREICEDSYFSNHGGENCLFYCKIFFACIYNQVPQQMESDKNDEWIKVDKEKFFEYNLTRSLIAKMEEIKRKINSYRVNRNRNKKRKDREEEDKQRDDEESVKRQKNNLEINDLEEGEIRELSDTELLPEIKRNEGEIDEGEIKELLPVIMRDEDEVD